MTRRAIGPIITSFRRGLVRTLFAISAESKGTKKPLVSRRIMLTVEGFPRTEDHESNNNDNT